MEVASSPRRRRRPRRHGRRWLRNRVGMASLRRPCVLIGTERRVLRSSSWRLLIWLSSAGETTGATAPASIEVGSISWLPIAWLGIARRQHVWSPFSVRFDESLFVSSHPSPRPTVRRHQKTSGANAAPNCHGVTSLFLPTGWSPPSRAIAFRECEVPRQTLQSSFR